MNHDDQTTTTTDFLIDLLESTESAVSVEELAKATVRALARHLSATYCAWWWTGPQYDQAWFGFDAGTADEAFRAAASQANFPQGTGVIGAAWRRGELVTFADAETIVEGRGATALPAGCTHALGLPIIVDGAVVAVVECLTAQPISSAWTRPLRTTSRTVGAAFGRLQAPKNDTVEGLPSSIELARFMEGTSTAVMFCGLDRKITYVNPANRAQLRGYVEKINAVFPGFDPANLIGVNIDGFHKVPAHQAALLNAGEVYSNTIEVPGDLRFNLTLVPMRNADGELIGNAVEWIDKTPEHLYTMEAERLLTALRNGDLGARGRTDHLNERFAPLMNDLNSLADTLGKPVQEAIAHLSRMALGELPEHIEAQNYEGDFKVLAQSINALIDSSRELADVAEVIAAGDLTVQIKERSEDDLVMTSLWTMVDQLNGILREVSTTTININGHARRVSESSQTLADTSATAAASLQELSASTEELSAQTTSNARHANSALELATANKDRAEAGAKHMKQMVSSMVSIDEASQSISNIIKVIDEIAFQTNLLALNAAVEAARAGIHGKGFAVVAEEVRSLAARSAKAAKETTVLIQGAIDKVANGRQIADATASVFDGILDSTSQTNSLVGEIAVASREQADGLAQVAEGLSQIDGVTQKNTAASESLASAAGDLSGQARTLGELIACFTIREEDISEQDMPEMTPELMKLFQSFLKARQSSDKASAAQISAPQAELTMSDDPFDDMSDDDFGRF